MGGKGGSRLDRNVDYTIDYQMGQLDLLSKQAQMADQIYVEYQSEALFVPQIEGVSRRARRNPASLWRKVFYRERAFCGRTPHPASMSPKSIRSRISKLLLDSTPRSTWSPNG